MQEKKRIKTTVDLILFGGGNIPAWSLGEVWPVEPTPLAISAFIAERLKSSEAEAWLFWDGTLPLPEAGLIHDLLEKPVDVWHAGLLMGMNGLPGMIDFVAGTWMLNRDPSPDIEATSWRLTLRASLIRCEVLIKMGGVHTEFRTLDGASLELGHRYITRGVIVRHVPSLVSGRTFPSAVALSVEDELRFIYYRFGRMWTRWAIFRGILARDIPVFCGLLNDARILHGPRPSDPHPFRSEGAVSGDIFSSAAPRLSVLIPTVDRYPYLRTLLGQIRTQTIKPFEIIIVDQTPSYRRDTGLADDFRDLPLKVFYMDKPGQCSSRNAGLQIASGDYICFLDDDDEIHETIFEAHLRNIQRFNNEVSSGVANEAGAGPLPENFRYVRMSDVFPTNNTLICRTVLSRSGLFDLAYDHGQRADGDLGMRIYLSGSLMMLNPEISVLHHHAPSGGLRTHKARGITYASSRKSLFQRHLPSATEIYLAKRYFTNRQVREMILLRVLGTFRVRGSRLRKIVKCLVSAVCLPHTLWQVYMKYRDAEQMLREFPRIPLLNTELDSRTQRAPLQ